MRAREPPRPRGANGPEGRPPAGVALGHARRGGMMAECGRRDETGESNEADEGEKVHGTLATVPALRQPRPQCAQQCREKVEHL